MRRRRREQLVVDVWKLFDDTRRALSDAWVDDIPPPQAVVEGIIENSRVEVGRQLRRALLHRRRFFRYRLKPRPARLAADATPDRRFL